MRPPQRACRAPAWEGHQGAAAGLGAAGRRSHSRLIEMMVSPAVGVSRAGSPEFCLTTQHLWGGGGLTPPSNPPSDPPPPILSDWANFSLGLQPIKNFLWRLQRKSVVAKNIFSVPLAPLTTHGLLGRTTAPPPPPLDPPP